MWSRNRAEQRMGHKVKERVGVSTPKDKDRILYIAWGRYDVIPLPVEEGKANKSRKKLEWEGEEERREETRLVLGMVGSDKLETPSSVGCNSKNQGRWGGERVTCVMTVMVGPTPPRILVRLDTPAFRLPTRTCRSAEWAGRVPCSWGLQSTVSVFRGQRNEKRGRTFPHSPRARSLVSRLSSLVSTKEN
ncbi:hypothetical protein ACLOJK_012759 [Asimina triloba]